MKDGKLLM